MRFERTDSFKADYRRLSANERELVRSAITEFAAACNDFHDRGTPFPAHLRVKAVRGAPGVFEMTWSFAGPDGRATWEWAEIEHTDASGATVRSPVVRWRRIGNHKIFRTP